MPTRAKRKYTIVETSGTCLQCSRPFTYSAYTGCKRRHCSPECRQRHQIKLRVGRVTRARVAGRKCIRSCGRVATRKGDRCEPCYCYERRTGVLGPAPKKRNGRYRDLAGYIRVNVPGHPIANKDGLSLEHRIVAYEMVGSGNPECYWCGVNLAWSDAVVDHLNEQKDDNRPENLAVSCNPCNRSRGALLPFVARMRSDVLPTFIRLIEEYRAAQR